VARYCTNMDSAEGSGVYYCPAVHIIQRSQNSHFPRASRPKGKVRAKGVLLGLGQYMM